MSSADGADFSKARLQRTDLSGAGLRGANFTDAALERVALLNVAAEESIWHGSRLLTTQTGGKASFARADLSAVTARQCGWRGADLRGANLSASRMVSCDFGTCSLEGADLRGALLWRSVFMQSSLRHCRLDGAIFFQALCRKADFRGSRLELARVLQTNLSEVRLDASGTEVAA